jgi:hypothetical protein
MTVSSLVQHEIYSIFYGQLIQGATSPLYGLNRPNETGALNATRWHTFHDLPPQVILRLTNESIVIPVFISFSFMLKPFPKDLSTALTNHANISS